MVLNINNERKYVDKDIVVKDQIQGGQQIDLSSFSIQVQGPQQGIYDGSDAIQKISKCHTWCKKITVNESNNTIEVNIPRGYASLNSYSIHYKTKITNETQPEFVNNSQIWYQENNQPEVNGESSNHTVKKH